MLTRDDIDLLTAIAERFHDCAPCLYDVLLAAMRREPQIEPPDLHGEALADALQEALAVGEALAIHGRMAVALVLTDVLRALQALAEAQHDQIALDFIARGACGARAAQWYAALTPRRGLCKYPVVASLESPRRQGAATGNRPEPTARGAFHRPT